MKFSIIAMLVLVIMGCKSPMGANVSSCTLAESYPVEYLGHAFGKGTIEFSQDKNAPEKIAYTVSVYTPESKEPAIAIKGLAQCQAGVVSGNFGSGTSSKPELSILGGRFEGIFNNPSIESPFGRWQVTLYDAKKDKNYNLSGYWQNHTKSMVTQR